jgi:histidine triad (HIT) family protein
MQKDKDCLFCKIIAGQLPAAKVFENDEFVCIRDIQPQAKTHLLVMPKTHVPSLETAFPEGSAGQVELIGKLFAAGTHVAREQGLVAGGFRSVINTNRYAGQTVFHVHLHILGGEPLKGGFGA